MFTKNMLIVASMALFATQAMCAAITTARSALIATDPFAACNCPNNCKHIIETPCAFYLPDSSVVENGFCTPEAGGLECVIQDE